MNIPSLSSIQESCVNYFIPSTIAVGSGITAVKVAAFLRSTMSHGMIPGIICGSGSIGDNICRLGSVGKAGIGLCVERMDWIQPLKPPLRFLSAAVNIISSSPAYLLGFTEKGVLNIALNAIGEELFYRELVQRVILRNIQGKILSQSGSNSETLVDHPIAKIARIAAASIIFGLMHTYKWECGYGGTIPEAAGGVIFGILAETKYGLPSSSLAHITVNLIILS
jgi:hypothetical protein